ncbi:DUF6492 family protein [Paenibacillus sp. FSL R5-0887]|jgi:hypothetical protein|uniref:DUF6492 family protein n=1 Tax=Paenibacillus TaxID=44249 RepID=UPI00096F7CE8|nr:DUF6492 family protein [Paenibacillus odorifer]OMC77012.1 hypothetical protein BK125_14935 [Paenibacillus odorifer]OMD56584.1 hypothetical protein BSK55_20800 [Paenibacillus odorifer]OMD65331.1 hypothetical protein BSK62_13680 [Paenibacillus odorifer]OMD96197.1 hypothetical protein BSK67_08290 [Paenibacillus odorifer]
MPSPSKARIRHAVTIDVLIPAIEKDLQTLPHVIDAVRKQVKHPIGRILIVAPKKKRMIEFCRTKGCTFIDENTVLPITKKDIHYRSRTWERSGWLFQQLLKLNGDKLCTADYFLVIDADTVLITPHHFRANGKTLFYSRNWSQPQYFVTYRKLMGRKVTAKSSFVTHYMLFERSQLAQMKREIEAKHQMPWYRAILHSMNRSKQFAFSEFETYANYLYSKNREGMKIQKARNKGLHMNAGQLSKQKVNQLAEKYRSLSFHKRKGYVRTPGAKSSAGGR